MACPPGKRWAVETLAGELDRSGAARGPRVREDLNAENVDAHIASLSRELRIRAQNRTGYEAPPATRTGTVVNRTA